MAKNENRNYVTVVKNLDVQVKTKKILPIV